MVYMEPDKDVEDSRAGQLPLIDIDLKQFVPRGAHVRNSESLYLLVLYTGNDTKLILNQGSYRFKQSHVD